MANAQGITIGSGAILNINDGTFIVPNNIVIDGEMMATTGTINVGGNWINNGTFTAGSGTVNFIDGQSPVEISGTSQFYNLNAVTTTGKQLNFEAAKEQKVTNLLKLQGDCASLKLLALRSTIPGQRAQINLENTGTQDIYAVDVMDHHATGQWLAPYFPEDIYSIDQGNNIKWFLYTYLLSVSKNGTGNGTVTSSPAGINCGADCSETYTSGTIVTLTATPDGTSTFTGWSGACSGTGGCVVTMDVAKSVTATFEALIPALVELPKTGQIDCYDINGDWIPCNGTGQDGEIQAGVPWPDPRFTDNVDGTITDNLTGLMWPEDANLMATKDPGFDTDGTSGDGMVRWQRALNYVAQLNTQAYLGYTDWRLPNVNEMEGLISFGRSNPSLPTDHMFTSLSTSDANIYWSSTTAEYSPSSAFLISIDTGSYDAWPKSSYFKVWPVRTSGITPVIKIPQTGQKDCYNTTGATIPCAGTGQDGDTRAGVPWPDPRFGDNGNGTVTDRLTGLTWAMDANLPGADTAWQQALDYVAAMNAGTYPNFGYTDWRLPNIKESQSLVDYGNYNPALVLNHPFLDLPNGGHWSSTSWIPPENAEVAWAIGITNGGMSGGVKSGDGFHVWPVRGGWYSEYGCFGLNPPIKPDKRYTLGSTIPVKFHLCNQSGDYVCTAGARIYIAQVIDGVVGQEMEGVSIGGANEGNIFRCDEDDKQYIFNLSTKDLTERLWQIRVELDDGTEFTGRIILDKRVKVDFQTGTQSGETTFTVSNSGPPPPSGHNFGAELTYFDISTTTIFSGSAEVCITYDETQFRTERSLKLFHWEGGSWKNITTSIDTMANIICGETTSFSPFIVAEELSTAVTISNISAQTNGDHVIITWTTSFEIDNEGFIVLRSESPGGPFTPITQVMIPAMGGGFKATYTFTDGNVEQGKTYYYRLQDIDSRGRVTAHQVIPVTVDVARKGESPQGTTGQGNDKGSVSQQSRMVIDKDTVQNEIDKPGSSMTWVSVTVSDNESKSSVVETDSATLQEEDAATANRVYKDVSSTDAEKLPQDAGLQRQPLAEAILDSGDHKVESQHSPSGPSSFSVSIEDDKGNLILVSRVEDTESIVTKANDLKVTEESDRVVITWEGRGGVKGFILHRTEKGKENYTPITNLIPYFGQGDKDIFIYRFSDNSVKQGTKYDYRLEMVPTMLEMGKRD